MENAGAGSCRGRTLSASRHQACSPVRGKHFHGKDGTEDKGKDRAQARNDECRNVKRGGKEVLKQT